MIKYIKNGTLNKWNRKEVNDIIIQYNINLYIYNSSQYICVIYIYIGVCVCVCV